jgi:hypothetical protein
MRLKSMSPESARVGHERERQRRKKKRSKRSSVKWNITAIRQPDEKDENDNKTIKERQQRKLKLEMKEEKGERR